jgi:hypothetical protein
MVLLSRTMGCSLLEYLAAAHHFNLDAEVSGPELQAVLGLDAVTVRAQVAELARLGLVEWDPLLSNLWIRINDNGLAAVEDPASRPGLG